MIPFAGRRGDLLGRAHLCWAAISSAGGVICGLAGWFQVPARLPADVRVVALLVVVAASAYAVLSGAEHIAWGRALRGTGSGAGPRRAPKPAPGEMALAAGHLVLVALVGWVLLRQWSARSLLAGLETSIALAGTVGLMSSGLAVLRRLVCRAAGPEPGSGSGPRPEAAAERLPKWLRIGLPSVIGLLALGLVYLESLPLSRFFS